MANTLSTTCKALLVMALASSGHLFSAEPPATSPFPTLLPMVNPDSARPTFATDPVRDQALRMILSLLPELRQKSAPFVRVAIPDTLELQRALALPAALPDNDPPVIEALPSVRPTLPAGAPK